MTTRLMERGLTFALTIALTAVPALAQSASPAPQSQPEKRESQPKQLQKPLEDKLNPLLIGKRDINKGQLDFYSLDKEIALGRQIAAETDRDLQFVNDPVITEYVNRVGQNIVLHSDAKVPFTIKVVDSNEVNAFALPGGNLYVNRGLIEAADNEAELAGVMAHEIAHVAARHGVEQASKGTLMNYASIPLIFLGGLGGYIVQQVAGLAVPLTFLKFSRGAEKEADQLGAQYMWAAGYDPNALVTFFEKLQEKNKKKQSTISKAFSTHPLTEDRIREVRKLVAQFPDKMEYEVSSSEFEQVKSRLVTMHGARKAIGGPEDPRRPTLKRRPQSDSSSDTTSTGDSGEQSAPDRPTLKRRSDSTDQGNDSKVEADKPSDQQSTTGRPTLKRRTDPDN
ncbi:MAG TPA: M48 family metallopeptidase [Blastocatellia bacterium]|nr:M48 family metallopeptidase [Blastocatellia bacterium]